MAKKEIYISDVIHPNLGIKSGAKLFFDQVKTFPQKEILINFKGSEFMSRSFAQEYVKQKKLINKKIIEINKPDNIDFMIEAVQKSPAPNLLNIVNGI